MSAASNAGIGKVSNGCKALKSKCDFDRSLTDL